MSNEEFEKMDKDLRFLEDNFINDDMTSIIVDIQLIKDFRKALDTLHKNKKGIEELKKPKYIMNFETGSVTKIDNDFISKDKIREKIEEEEEHLDFENTEMEDHTIAILNELLEEK